MSKMFAEERRKQILEILFEKKRVTIQELANAIEVSDATLRNDLTTLEKMNLLKELMEERFLRKRLKRNIISPLDN